VIGRYYEDWSLNANPGKTKVCAYHLNNREASRKLNIDWNGKSLIHDDHPTYLGVTLDRTLSFRSHVERLRKKVSSRLNLVKKLAGTKWGTDPKTLRTAVLALCYSTAEYCTPVWARSSHASKIDPVLNEACRVITGALRPTPVNVVHRLSGIPPPALRRETTTKVEKRKQEQDARHPLYSHIPPPTRLRSRKSFTTVERLPDGITPRHYRMYKWREMENLGPEHPTIPVPKEKLPKGTNLGRKEWCTLNRARSGVGKTRDNLTKWGLATSTTCDCGFPIQDMDHILFNCPRSIHI